MLVGDGLRRLPMAVGVLVMCAAAPLAGETLPERLAAAHPARGAQAFVQCRVCHTSDAGGEARIGPNLWNVVGRDIASLPDFDYSPALSALEGAWTFEALDAFLEHPTAYVPGTRMGYAGIGNGAVRADLIAHLRSLSDTPLPLPAPVASGSATAGGQAAMSDPFGEDWPQGPGRDQTGFVCSACHSLAIVKQQGLNRRDWDDLLVWMVEEQGMPELSAEQRDQVLDFLAQHFGRDRKRQ